VIMSDDSGSDLRRRADEKFCFDCGAVISSRAEICPNCGVRQASLRGASSSGGRSKLAAGLLALFLGGIGVHKFYLGRPLQGVLYLLFCWTFIPAIIGFVEGLVYLAMSQDAFDRRYNPKRAIS